MPQTLRMTLSAILIALVCFAIRAEALILPGHYEILQKNKVVGELLVLEDMDGILLQHVVLFAKYKSTSKVVSSLRRSKKSFNTTQDFIESVRLKFVSGSRYFEGVIEEFGALPDPDDGGLDEDDENDIGDDEGFLDE